MYIITCKYCGRRLRESPLNVTKKFLASDLISYLQNKIDEESKKCECRSKLNQQLNYIFFCPYQEPGTVCEIVEKNCGRCCMDCTKCIDMCTYSIKTKNIEFKFKGD